MRTAKTNTQPQTAQAAEVALFKKAINLQASVAATLLDALPQPAPPNLGPMGTQLDRFA